MNVDVTQKKVPLTWTHDGSECQPGSTGLRKVEFCAKAVFDQARAAVRMEGMSFIAIKLEVMQLVVTWGEVHNATLFRLHGS